MYSLRRGPLRLVKSYSTSQIRCQTPRAHSSFLTPKISPILTLHPRWNSTKKPSEDLPTQSSPNSNDNTAPNVASASAPVPGSKPVRAKKETKAKTKKPKQAADQNDTEYIDLASMSPTPAVENREDAPRQTPLDENSRFQKDDTNMDDSDPSPPPNPFEKFERFNPTKPPSETVYIGNLFWDLEAEDLRAHFEQFGTVVKTLIVHDARGMSKGFGYIQFSSPEEAALAIEKQNLQHFAGRKCVMQFARTPVVRKRPVEERPTNTLFIGNLPYELTDRDLQELFSNIYDVTDIRIPVDRRNGSMRGFAHVEFLNVKSACEGKEILMSKRPYDRRLMVEFSDSKKALIFNGLQAEPEMRSNKPQGEPETRSQWTGAGTRESDMQQPEPEEPLSAAEVIRRKKEAKVAAEEEARIQERIAARLAAAGQKTGSSGDA